MKNLLPEYFEPTDEEIKQVWQNGTIVLDANVLLNLFRYSAKSREELIKILEHYKDRLWIPYQIAFEFLENSISVPSSLSRSLSDTLKAIDSIAGTLESLLKLNQYDKYHLLKPDDLRKDFKKFQSKMHEKVEKIQKEYNAFDVDEIVKRITELFDGKVGPDFSEDDLSKIIKEGEKRYNEKVPPRYEDLKTKKDAPKRHLYGDLIWWEQAMKYSKDNHLDLVIVTDDSKEDWWYKVDNEIKHPRVELIKEFRIKTEGQKFHMYRTSRFMELAKKYDSITISDKSIKEVKSKSSQSVLSAVDWSSIFGKQPQDDSPLGIASRMTSYYGGGVPESQYYGIIGSHFAPAAGSIGSMISPTDQESLINYYVRGGYGGKNDISPLTGITGTFLAPDNKDKDKEK